MNLSQSNRAPEVRATASGGDEQALVQRAEIESRLEAVGKCGQVSSGVLSEVECMIATGQTGLDVAEAGVDPLELGQVFWRSSSDDGRLIQAPGPR